MIQKEFWERFKNEKIAVHCKTEDEAKDFVKQCYDNGIKWFNSIYDSNYNVNTTDYKKYENGIYYRIFFDPANKISFVDENMHYCRNNNYTIISFSEINKSIKEETKMSEFNYRGKDFTNPVDYANYILKCAEDDKSKVEQERQNKLKAEKEKRTEELSKAYDEYKSICQKAKEKYVEIRNQYYKDYNYGTKPNYISLDEFLNDFNKIFRF